MARKTYVKGLSKKLVLYLTEHKVRRTPEEMCEILGLDKRDVNRVTSISAALSAQFKKTNSVVSRGKRPGTNVYEYWVREAPEKQMPPAMASCASIESKIGGVEALLTHVSQEVNTLTMSIASLISSVEEASLLLMECKQEIEKKPDVDEDVLKALQTLQSRLNV